MVEIGLAAIWSLLCLNPSRCCCCNFYSDSSLAQEFIRLFFFFLFAAVGNCPQNSKLYPRAGIRLLCKWIGHCDHFLLPNPRATSAERRLVTRWKWDSWKPFSHIYKRHNETIYCSFYLCIFYIAIFKKREFFFWIFFESTLSHDFSHCLSNTLMLQYWNRVIWDKFEKNPWSQGGYCCLPLSPKLCLFQDENQVVWLRERWTGYQTYSHGPRKAG